ncbi:type I methionyl aminopeptidase [Xanthomonas cassavae CFBP 4642]|uniref:Methionine aminopeptidase n=1 Tax=Xanthomonas cassavae CFBP 4642 TaxID=1219375 RepID=A0ABS8HJY8_9XANT|nr:type I methionyl aminopeptidase [Xanthomonas cassavae]MCC4622403.1 type I methionyl aminopeptidase [Xanthomonas cassavae CFBP 4642]
MIKRPEEIALMATSGQLLAQVFHALDQLPLEGHSTLELNDLVERMIVDRLDARPASKGQYGFEFVLNASIDDVVCHGVPSADDVLCSGQIVNLDITLEKNGFIADSSTTYLVGEVAYPARRLVHTAYQAMWKGIAAVRPGARLGDIGYAIARHVRDHGYSVVKEYCGHGIGREMHEEPQILHYGHAGTGMALQEGMTFTIEPMINQGRATIRAQADQWPAHTRDGKLSAQFEHTVAVTRDGVRVLTLRPGETPLCRLG